MASFHRILPSMILLVTCCIICNHSQLIDCSSDECICPDSLIPGETCILNCNTEDSCKSSTLRCRSGDPCEIRCEAKTACAQDTNIIGATATDVTLICNGEDTCKSATTLDCGSGDCFMSCRGTASCDEFGGINVSSSASFQCTGNCPSNIPAQFTRAPTTASPTTTSTTTTMTTTTTTQTPSVSSTNPPQDTLSPTFQPTPILSLESSLSLSSSTSTTSIDTTTSIIIATVMRTISTSFTSTQNMVLQSDANEDLDPNGTILMIDLDDIHPLYYAITLLLLLIIVVCSCLFCWIYITNRNTQKLIKEQQARLDSKSPQLEFQNSPLPFKGLSAAFRDMQCVSDTNPQHKIAVVSPTTTSRSTCGGTHIYQHASPRMYRVHSIEKTPTTINKHFATNYESIPKRAKHEGNVSDTTLTDSDTNLSSSNSNALSKDIWDVPSPPKDGDLTTLTAAIVPRNTETQLQYIGCPPYNNIVRVPPAPPLPSTNVANNKMKVMNACDLSVPSWKYGADSSYHSCYGYAVTLKHVQLQHAMHYGSGTRLCPSVTEITATGTLPSELSHCSESDCINSSILQHMNTQDDTHCGEAYDDSMIAVRHPTISNDPYEHRVISSTSPMFHVHVKSGDSDALSGLTLVDLNSKTMDTEETLQPPHVDQDQMENVKNRLLKMDTENNMDTHDECGCEEHDVESKRREKEMQNVLTLHKRVVIEIPEIPEEISKSFKSYTMDKRAANEFSKDCFNEDSIDANEFDRNSYAIQLVDDEPTLTQFKSHSKTTSSVMDTYLKFLNI